MSSKTFYIDTLGCQKNEYDSQILGADLMKAGCRAVMNPEEADILIVNTCGFIDAAKMESIEHIFDMARIKGEKKKLVVTGCLSQRFHKELSDEMPEVDLFFGVNDYDDIAAELLEDGPASGKVEETAADGATENRDKVRGSAEKVLHYKDRIIPKGTYSSVLKIAEGCNNTCSFCAIPAIRGPFRSKPMEECIREAEQMAADGVEELVIIAQDTSQYGIDLYGEVRLPQLLRELCKIDGIRWIRLMYVYDEGITDELMDVIASEPKICKYIDIPIQHISDHVLTMMRRRSDKASIIRTINKLREKVPGIHIRTTLLVGFPGEAPEDHQELLEFVKEAKIDRLGVFSFSDEEGTLAHSMPGKLEQEEKNARRDEIMEAQQEVSLELNQKKVGMTYEVLIDEAAGQTDDGDLLYIGRTQYDGPEIDDEVEFCSSREHQPGEFVRVVIDEAGEYDLLGREI